MILHNKSSTKHHQSQRLSEHYWRVSVDAAETRARGRESQKASSQPQWGPRLPHNFQWVISDIIRFKYEYNKNIYKNIWIPVETPETRGREGESKSLVTTTVATTSNTQLPMGQYHYIQMSIFFYIPTIIAGGRESQKASQPQPQWRPPHNFQWVTTDVITHWYLDILLYSNNQFLFGDSPGLGTWRQR